MNDGTPTPILDNASWKNAWSSTRPIRRRRALLGAPLLVGLCMLAMALWQALAQAGGR